MEFSRRGYTKQIMLYLQNKEYAKAYKLSSSFRKEFPDEMISNYLYSNSSFWTKRYDDAIVYGKIAFNKCKSKDEMIASAVVVASAYFNQEEYKKAMKILNPVEKLKCSEVVEKLMLAISIAMKDKKEALRHAKNLHVLNKEVAEEVLNKYLEEF